MEITYTEKKTEIISVETLIRLAKRIRQLGNANVIINVGWDGEVLMDDKAFMEMFPEGYEEDPEFEGATGSRYISRHINVDGVEFRCIINT